MKRDYDLIRKILLAIESSPTGYAPRNLAVEGYNYEEIGYHVHLMGQAGLLNTSDVTGLDSSSPEALAQSITWEGHNFLDSMRSETIWNKAKSTLLKSTPEVAFDVLKAWLKAEALKLIGGS